jgi:hypothetical protein
MEVKATLLTRCRDSALCLMLATVVLVAGIYQMGRAETSVVLDAPYELVEWQALSALGIDRNELTAKRHSSSRARGEVGPVLMMETHNCRLIEYAPDSHIRFRGDHRYNIMATGGERFEVAVERTSPGRTRVTVDYFESTRLFGVIPVTYRIGKSQERRLLKAMFGY